MGLPLHHFGMTVSNLDRSVGFYTGYFDVVETRRIPLTGDRISSVAGVSGVSMTCALLAAENVLMELIEYTEPKGEPYRLRNCDIGSAHPCFSVEDLDALYERMVADGVHFYGKPVELGWDSKMTYCSDPDGITVQINQPGPELLLPVLLKPGPISAPLTA